MDWKTVHELTVSNSARECAALALDKHDIIPPTYVDNQPGDDTWRNENTGVYNVTFNDIGGSYLNKFQIKATTATNETSAIILNWTDNLFFPSETNSYTTPWGLNSNVWSRLREGINYIHLRIFDGVENTTLAENVFYVKKDTTASTVPSLVSPADSLPDKYGYIVYKKCLGTSFTLVL